MKNKELISLPELIAIILSTVLFGTIVWAKLGVNFDYLIWFFFAVGCISSGICFIMMSSKIYPYLRRDKKFREILKLDEVTNEDWKNSVRDILLPNESLNTHQIQSALCIAGEYVSLQEIDKFLECLANLGYVYFEREIYDDPYFILKRDVTYYRARKALIDHQRRDRIFITHQKHP